MTSTAHPAGCGCLACPDPHEDWYFELLPPDWKRMRLNQRLAYIERMDPVQRAECRRRMEHRKVVAAGRFLAQQARRWEPGPVDETVTETAVDDALDWIANRTEP